MGSSLKAGQRDKHVRQLTRYLAYVQWPFHARAHKRSQGVRCMQVHPRARKKIGVIYRGKL